MGSWVASSSIYEDLPASDDKLWIRVLFLFPGTTTDPIQCQLRPISLENETGGIPYEALSYSWGNPPETEPIQCNGQEVYIRPNLEAALRQLRLPDRTRVLWADAICINQQNIPERNYQVSIMALVYRHAERVVVWLGEATDTTEEAFWLIDKLASAVDKFGESYLTDRRVSAVWNWPELKEYLGVEVNAFQYFVPGPVNSLNQLMQRAWFSRLWIVQEVTGAKDIVVFCGSFTIPWRRLYEGIRFAGKVSIAIDSEESPAYYCWSPFELRLEEKADIDILYLLQSYRYAKCVDPRDKIFALFGLGYLTHLKSLRPLREEFKSLDIAPDYRRSIADLYKHLTYKMIETKGNLDILSTIGLSLKVLPGLPTWTPDWSPSRAVSPLLNYLRSRSELQMYRCSLETKASPKLIDNTLVLKGFIYDTITTVADEYQWFRPYVPDPTFVTTIKLSPRIVRDYSRPHFQWIYTSWKLFAQWDYIALTLDPRPRADAIEQYWQTLICASKHDITAFPAAFNGSTDETKIRNLFEIWYGWRLFCRLGYRLGIAKFLPRLYTICVILDTLLMIIWSPSRSGMGTKFTAYTKNAGRRLARTERGHLAVVAPEARPGDAVGVFEGGKTPLILRSTEEGKTWMVLGDGYVHGIMKGEVWDRGKCEEILLR